jgi:hypothetical protein
MGSGKVANRGGAIVVLVGLEPMGEENALRSSICGRSCSPRDSGAPRLRVLSGRWPQKWRATATATLARPPTWADLAGLQRLHSLHCTMTAMASSPGWPCPQTTVQIDAAACKDIQPFPHVSEEGEGKVATQRSARIADIWDGRRISEQGGDVPASAGESGVAGQCGRGSRPRRRRERGRGEYFF